MSKTLLYIASTLLVFCAVGCSDSSAAKYTISGSVEIAPDKWLSVKAGSNAPLVETRPLNNPHQLTVVDAVKQFVSHVASTPPVKEKCSLSFAWKGKNVKWQGVGQIPITLREHGGTLYMITFNREKLAKGQCDFVFLKLGSKGTSFKTITARDFPRQIATQNMWLRPVARYATISITAINKTYLVDTWRMLRTLDIYAPAFGFSFTAKIWYCIETGTRFDKISFVEEDFLKNYVEKFKPIALPTITMAPSVEMTNSPNPNVEFYNK